MPFPIAFSHRALALEDTPQATRASEHDTIPSDGQRAAVEEALARGETHYTDRPGILALRQKIASALRARFGLHASGEADLLVTCGVVEARFAALQQLLSPGDTVHTPHHFDRIRGAMILRRAESTSEPSGARLLYLTSSSHEAGQRQHLQELSSAALVLFEVDTPDTSFHPSHIDGFADRTITVGPLGNPSWQMGYLLAPRNASAGLRDFKQALTICSTNLSQWAVLAAMEAV